jgi:hypothetical protein
MSEPRQWASLRSRKQKGPSLSAALVFVKPVASHK